MLIHRIRNKDKQTNGNGYIYNDEGHIIHKFYTLELPWKNNETSISCIPLGIYDVKKRKSAKFGNHFHVLDVPGRSFILLHHGNYYTDIRGCILVGQDIEDINGDGNEDVVSSKLEMKSLLALMPDTFKLHISNANQI